MKRLATAIAMIGSTFILTGCLSNNDDLEEWMKHEAEQMKGKVTPLPAVKPFTPIEYIGREMNDPFAPKRVSKTTANAPDEKRKKEFLESFPLDRLIMVGTIKKKGELWALIQAPDYTISMVKPGDYLGQNFGKVNAVKDNALRIKESVLDPQGDWAEREIDLNLAVKK